MKGRGAPLNPANRFQPLELERDPEFQGFSDEGPAQAAPLRTRFWHDHSRSIITTNSSPDIPFDASLNPYRGCEHGCAYCYARPSHEYLGFSAGLDFESQIVVKREAPTLLRQQLAASGWTPQVLALSGVTDPYQPVERRLGLTRACLEVLADFANPVGVITKNHLVTRDIDVLVRLARVQAVRVNLSITTLDRNLARVLEPRASEPSLRLAAIEKLAQAGIPVGVMVAPVIPALNDHEIPAVLQAAARAGARHAAFIPLRLPLTVVDVFTAWLEEHFPDRAAKVLHRIQEIRGGKLNDSNFFSRFQGQGPYYEQMRQLFAIGMRQAGLPGTGTPLSTQAFQVPGPRQLGLFE